MESKLECLVSQLQSRQILGDGDGDGNGDGDGSRSTSTNIESREPPPEQPGASSFANLSSPFLRSNTLIEDVDDSNTQGLVDPLTEPSGPGPGPGTITTGPHTGPTASESLDDDDLLIAACFDTFTSSMLPYFPFIHFPPGLTADRLRRDRPLLLRAVVCVAWPFPREKRARALELKRTLLEAYFMRQQQKEQQQQHWDQSGEGGEEEEEEDADSSTDLLLALLTYVAWGWDHAHSRGGSLSYLMMPCMSLAGEMFLDRPAPRGLHTATIFAPHSEIRHDADRLSPERRRAVLGCFALSSVVSSFFADMDAMNWTPQMEQALATISTSQECPGDAGLVLQTRLQLLCLKAVKLRCHLQVQPPQTQPAFSAASVTMEAEGLLEQLQELSRSSSSTSEHHHHQVSLAHMSYVEIQILETIRASSLISSQSEEADRRYIWQSTLALEACTSALLDLPPSRFRAISFVQWAQLADCLVVLRHLGDVRDERIDRASARAVVDLPVLLDRVVERLTLTATEALEEEHEGTFTLLASRARAFRSSMQGSTVEVDRPFRPSQGPFQNPKIWIDQLFAA